MRIIKHSSASPDAVVKVADFFNDGITHIVGNWITVANNDIKLTDGDYILVDDDGNVNYVSLANYNGDNFIKQRIKEQISKEAARNAWKALMDSNLTNAQKAAILVAVNPAFTALAFGEIQAARIIANNTATDANYTAGVKNSFISILDAGIAKL